MEKTYLNCNILPEFITCDLRKFMKNESHINRTVSYDVLIIMLDGVLNFSENGKEVSLQKGEWYIQKAGLHQQGTKQSLMPRYYYIHFKGYYIGDKESGIPIYGKIAPDEIDDIFLKLYRKERALNPSRIECCSLFYSILTYLQESIKKKGESYRTIKKMEKYLIENSCRRITIQDLSEAFQYSPDHMIRMFKKSYDITPGQYLYNLRFKHASRLMLTTDHTLETIAEESGYSDVSGLYRAFIKKTKMSPSKWRDANLTENQKGIDFEVV